MAGEPPKFSEPRSEGKIKVEEEKLIHPSENHPSALVGGDSFTANHQNDNIISSVSGSRRDENEIVGPGKQESIDSSEPNEIRIYFFLGLHSEMKQIIIRLSARYHFYVRGILTLKDFQVLRNTLLQSPLILKH